MLGDTRDARLSFAQQLLFSFILVARYRDAIYLFTGSAVYMSLLLHLLLIRFVKNCRISSVPYTAQRSSRLYLEFERRDRIVRRKEL